MSGCGYPPRSSKNFSGGRTLASAAGLVDILLRSADEESAQEIQAFAVSHTFFDLLGITPALGRDFDESDDRRGASPVAIVSDTFWRTRFAADPSVIGRSIRFDDQNYRIIGVLPRSFAMLSASSVMPDKADAWS